LTLLPLCVNAGYLVGPLIGGFLVTYGDGRRKPSLFSRYPYAAPNIFIASLCVVVALGVVFVLDETLDNARFRSQRRGQSQFWRSCRSWIASRLPSNRSDLEGSQIRETEPLLEDVRNENSPMPAAVSPIETRPNTNLTALPFRKMWKSNVIATMATYFIISGHMGTFPSLWAIFLSVPADRQKSNQAPIQLHGGLGMNPRFVGIALSLQGIIGVLMQVVFYPRLNDRFGAIRLWRAGLLIFPIAYFLAPFCANIQNYVRRDPSTPTFNTAGEIAVWAAVLFVLLLVMVGRTGVAPATTLLINDCTPHPSVRGTIHTTGTIVSSLSRCVFPPAALAIFGYGDRIGFVALGFWFVAGLAGLACVASLWVAEGNNCSDLAEEEGQPRRLSTGMP
jgi:MFS family permease